LPQAEKFVQLREIFALEDSGDLFALRSDGKRLATGASQRIGKGLGEVGIWDVAARRRIVALTGHRGNIRAIAYSPNGRRLITASTDQTIRIWDANSGREVIVLHRSPVLTTAVAFGPDGNKIAAAGEDGTLRLWDATPLEE
jgi:WD40 repeat protein